MTRLAVIVTAYGERGAANLPRVVAALAAQTRPADFVIIGTEDIPALRWPGILECGAAAERGYFFSLDTPRHANGRYAEIPYALKINRALDYAEREGIDYVAYLTDDSTPHPEKYARMVAALDEHPDWGAVYCAQEHAGGIRSADQVIDDAYCAVDHTQVMHRLTADRWPTEIDKIRLGDAHFWRALHRSLGSFYPVPEVLDAVQQTPDGISATY